VPGGSCGPGEGGLKKFQAGHDSLPFLSLLPVPMQGNRTQIWRLRGEHEHS